ncbi:MAG: hypothetical protein AVDCRST_MAG22-2040, partial [uncultured Rubrobacteraceae bacterium]
GARPGARRRRRGWPQREWHPRSTTLRDLGPPTGVSLRRV